MNFTPLTADYFFCESKEHREEAFIMAEQLGECDLERPDSPYPEYPNIISFDVAEPLRKLKMFTNNLHELAAPAELCIQKALELIQDRDHYELNVEAFKMDLLSGVVAEQGANDVNSLIAGIRCLCKFLMQRIDLHTGTPKRYFPYEYYRLYGASHLFLNIISPYAALTPVRPAAIHLPAYTYPEVQAETRAHYIAEANQCLVF